MNILSVAIAGLISVIFLSSCGYFMNKVEGSYREVIPISNIAKLEIENTAGNTVIKQGSSDRIEWVIKFSVRAGNLKFAKKTLQEISQTISQSLPVFVDDDTVRIGSIQEAIRRFLPEQGFCILSSCTHVSVSYELKVPGNIDLEYSSSSGNIEIENISGKITVDVQSGNTRLQHTSGMIQISSKSGNIFAEDVGALLIDLKHGNLKATGVKNGIIATTTSGNARLKNISGVLSMTTKSGNVMVDSLIEKRAHWTISSRSGNVKLRMHKSVNFGLNLATSSGNIDVELSGFSYHDNDRHLDGQVGSEQTVKIKIETLSGNIDIIE